MAVSLFGMPLQPPRYAARRVGLAQGPLNGGFAVPSANQRAWRLLTNAARAGAKGAGTELALEATLETTLETLLKPLKVPLEHR